MRPERRGMDVTTGVIADGVGALEPVKIGADAGERGKVAPV